MRSSPVLAQDIFDILYKSDVGIAICDNEGRFIWGNPQYQNITGFDIHTAVGQHILDLQLSHGVTVQGYDNMLSVVLRNKVSLTSIVDFNTTSGHDIIVTATPLFNADGSLRWVMYSLTDCDQVFEMRQRLNEVTERMERSQTQLQEVLLEREGVESGYVIRDSKSLSVYTAALRMAKVSATVLILGETGTGKDHLAKFIHQSSARKDGNFVHVNCSAIPENLFESELFGYEAGSFTGASRKGKMGLIEFASGGTLYLDEIAELPLSMQTKLLSVLQSRMLTRIGGVNTIKVDVRVIAATNRNLQKMVADQTFREDLYYRINVLELSLPPLRERRDDIAPLVHFFLKRFNETYKERKQFSSHALYRLSQYAWPGNIRELEHMVERLVIMTSEDFIGEEHVLPLLQSQDVSPFNFSSMRLKDILEDVEKQVIKHAIQSSSSLMEAAKNLGIELSTLTRKKQKYNIYLKKDYIYRKK